MIVGARNRCAIVISRAGKLEAVIVVPQHEAQKVSEQLTADDSQLEIEFHDGPFFCDSAQDALEVLRSQPA